MSSTHLKALPYETRFEWEEFFWDQVESKSECWEWQGHIEHSGYGSWRIPREGSYKAHRLSYILANGPLPNKDLLVLHRCDNRRCCRPSHLFLGTNEDNSWDRQTKGRGNYLNVKGENNSHSKLTESEVRAIHQAVLNGSSVRSVSRLYNVFPNTIKGIIRGVTWKHLDLQPIEVRQRVRGHYLPHTKYTDADVGVMAAIRRTGTPYHKIDAQLGNPKGTSFRLLNRNK